VSLRRAQRRLAIRVIRAYRTVSFEAATVLAGTPPLDLLAGQEAANFRDLRALRAGTPGGAPLAPGQVEVIRRRNRRRTLAMWREQLAACAGQRAVGAVLPLLSEWLDRRSGALTFRVTQVLTGHGCFGSYLRRIGKEATSQCHHCGADEDTAQHTLESCPAWLEERRVLVDVIGRDLSLAAVVRSMIRGGEGSWQAVASFCETVISRKEAAERGRELHHDPARRGRPRRDRVRGRPP
jgi:hypothetical protein